MAAISQGIVGGEMAWPLVVVGIFMGIAMILVQVRSPMLVAVGMYLPLETTFAIFVGGVIRAIVDKMAEKKGLNQAQKTRVENVGILLASGLIAGEALTGLVRAGLTFAQVQIPVIFQSPSYWVGGIFLILIAIYLIAVPLRNAGSPEEEAPPSAVV